MQSVGVHRRVGLRPAASGSARPALFLRALALAAATAACLAGEAAAQGAPARPASPAGAAWLGFDFDRRFAACAPAVRPGWCVDWFRAMDARVEPFGDRSVPEWRTLAFADNLRTCGVRLPPQWCREWLADARSADEDPRYRGEIDEIRAELEAIAAESARIAAEREAYERPFREAAARVADGRQSPADVALVEERALLGDVEAMELLAWMHTVGGRGVPRSYARAYEIYGRLVLAGREDLRPNLDSLWPRLSRADQEALHEMFRDGDPGPLSPGG
jgi:hypothetical protein